MLDFYCVKHKMKVSNLLLEGLLFTFKPCANYVLGTTCETYSVQVASAPPRSLDHPDSSDTGEVHVGLELKPAVCSNQDRRKAEADCCYFLPMKRGNHLLLEMLQMFLACHLIQLLSQA